MRLIFALAIALAALAVIPSGASATFGIANFKFTPSTMQAAGHPNLTISFDRTGTESEDLKDVQLDLPTGLFANPEAGNTKCTDAQFNSDTCPDSSYVGTSVVKITAASVLNQTVNGSINVLTPAANQAATLGITLRPAKICILLVFCATPNKIYLKTGLTIRSFNDSGVRTYTPGNPTTSTLGIPLLVTTGSASVDITVKSLSLTFQAKTKKAATGPYFMVNSTSCAANTAGVTIISNTNVAASATAPYTPTGCSSVPFAPTTSFTVPDTTSGLPVKPTFKLTVPQADATIQNSHPKVVDIDLPNGSGLYTNSLSGVTGCSEQQLKDNACPSNSVIGTASSNAPMLPPTLTGTVYAMDPIGTQVPVGIRLNGARGTLIIFRGVLGVRGEGATGHVYARFDAIPQMPYADFQLTFTTPIYKNPDACGAANSTGTVTGFSGASKAVSMTYNVTGCAPAPDTTITAGPANPTVNNTPTFSFSSTIAGSTFQCQMDAGGYQLCTSPWTSAALGNGSHTFSVYAVNGLTPDPSPATYTFTVNTGNGFTITPTITPSTNQAAAHPDLATKFDIAGGQPKTLQVKLPDGFSASLAAVSQCSNTDAAAGNCSAASKIGTGSVTVNTFNGSETGVGDIFLTQGPTGSDAGGIAIKFPLSFGTLTTQAGAYLVNNGKNQYINLRNIPNNLNGTDFTASQLVLNFSGANRFLTNSSSCAASSFDSTGTAVDGSIAANLTVAYQATGCSSVPFAPSLTQTFSNPVAGQTTGDVVDVTLPADNGTIKNLRVLEPPVIGANFPAFGTTSDQCPSASAATSTSTFDPTSCPAQAKVGTMTITTPLLTTPLVGDVYLINKSPLPWFGVKFDQPGISIRLIGATSTPQVDPACDINTDPSGFCQTQIAAQFNSVPDTPISSVEFALNGPNRTAADGSTLSGNILALAQPGDSTCLPSSAAKANVTSWTGTLVSLSQNIAITGC